MSHNRSTLNELADGFIVANVGLSEPVVVLM